MNSLRLKLDRGRRRYETSVEAYDLYLRARALEIRGSFGKGGLLFEQAIAKDPSFAPAYAGLAGFYQYRSGTYASGGDELARMRTAAEKAIQLDPLLAEAHDALGMVYARDGKWDQSEKSFRCAIKLDLGRSMSYGNFAIDLLLVLGRIEEALQQLRAAERADPLSPLEQFQLAYVLTSAGRYDEAASHCQKLPADYSFTSSCLGRARLGQGRAGEAIQILAKGSGNDRAYLGCAYGRAGRRGEAEKLAADLSPNSFYETLIFGLGGKARTLEALDRMTVLCPVRIGRTLTFPELALLRGDPRLKAIRKKVGLPE